MARSMTPAASRRRSPPVDLSPVDQPADGSFRDPSGFVFRRDGVVLRQVNRSFAERWDDLRASGLLTTLQKQGLLIDHSEVDRGLAAAPDLAHAVLQPEPLAFVSYPYEWAFGLLKDAALATLEAQSVASAAGFGLRDASAYNVQLHRGRPILIDTLSFERVRPDAPWRAYRQFCEHFLAPLALMAHRDVRCGLLMRDFIDGVPVDLAASLLPGRTKIDVGLASHIHAHGRAVRRASRRVVEGPPTARMGGVRRAALFDSLRRTVDKLSWEPAGTPWSGYAEATTYSAAAERSKDQLVRQLLEAGGGAVVWDLGANTGRFSRIAATLGRTVVAWDADAGATELNYREVRKGHDASIIPLLSDLTNPSPGLGWANEERRSLIGRANADVVLALALAHHLVIGKNIRLAMVADLLARLAPQAIVEFVPDTDPMAQQLLKARDDVKPSLTIEAFRQVFETRFDILDDLPIEDSERRLLRVRRR